MRRSTLSSSRRGFLKTAAATAAGVALSAWAFRDAPAITAAEAGRPQALQGLDFGDPADGSVVVWSRSDRPSRMLVDWSYDESFANARRIAGPHALDTTDFTARQAIEGLEAGSDVFVRVSFQSLDNARALSAPVTGRFVGQWDDHEVTNNWSDSKDLSADPSSSSSTCGRTAARTPTTCRERRAARRCSSAASRWTG